MSYIKWPWPVEEVSYRKKKWSKSNTSTFRQGNVGGVQALDAITNYNGGQFNSPDLNTFLDNGWYETWSHIPYDISGLTNLQVQELLMPGLLNGFSLRGYREFYYSEPPFADIEHPTIPEIETWNLNMIIHLRRLAGWDHIPIEYDRGLCLRAQWSLEKLFSTAWTTPPNEGYDINTPAKDFIPTAWDQRPYFTNRDDVPVEDTPAYTFFGTTLTGWDWSIKMANCMYRMLRAEPVEFLQLFSATRIGIAFHVDINTPSSLHFCLKFAN